MNIKVGENIMPKNKCCVFTFVKDEKIFLPIWLKYYSRFFDKDDIYVLDHDSNDGSVEECSKDYGFKVIKLHHEFYDDMWRRKIVCQKQAELLQSYEYVLYADADEIIIPNPRIYKDLKDYIIRCVADCVICTGYELIHIRQKEPPIDLNKSILKQRKYWYYNYFYCKPLLARKPLAWGYGFHSAVNMGDYKDGNLWLFHLHKLDFVLCWDKHKRILGYNWNDECIKRNLSFQLRINNLEDFNFFFDTRHPDMRKLKTIVWWYFPMVLNFVKSWIKARILRKGVAPTWYECSLNFPVITKIPKTLIKRNII